MLETKTVNGNRVQFWKHTTNQSTARRLAAAIGRDNPSIHKINEDARDGHATMFIAKDASFHLSELGGDWSVVKIQTLDSGRAAVKLREVA